jgi:hypothetical protein
VTDRRTASPATRSLLRCALGPDAVARAAWAEVRCDIQAIGGLELDALCLAALRLAELGVDQTDRALAVGVARHAWTSGQLLLRELPALDDRPVDGQPPVLAGRVATVVGYLPVSRVLPIKVLELARRPGPTVETTVLGKRVRVPTPAAHLVDCLLERRWVDAAWMALGVEPPLGAVASEAGRRRQRVAVLRGLRTLGEIVGQDLAGPAEAGGIGPSRFAAAKERGWAAAFAGTRRLRWLARSTEVVAPAPPGTRPAAGRP